MKSLFNKLIIGFDRSFSKGFWSQVFWLIGLGLCLYLLLICLSLVGGFYHSGAEESLGRWYDVLFVLVDPGSSTEAMSTPFTLLCAILGLIIFGGMLISMMSNVLERRVESYTNGEMAYDLNNHVVILGYNKSIPSLLEEIAKKHPRSHILLITETNVVNVRDWVHANVDKTIEDHLIIMSGSRIAKDDLDRLCLKNGVREIYVVGEVNEDSHDDISMTCIEMLAERLPEGRVDCHVQFESPTMYSILQTVPLDKQIADKITLLPFDFNEIWAQKALAIVPTVNKETGIYTPLDGNGIGPESKKHVHLVLIGMNDMAISLAVNAAHILHFPNFIEGDFGTCSHITFIDRNAEGLGREFRVRYSSLFELSRWRSVTAEQSLNEDGWQDPIVDLNSISSYRHLGPTNFMDIQWDFIEGEACEKPVIDYLTQHVTSEQEILSIVLCDNNSESNASFCLSLPEVIRMKSHQILVRQKDSPMMINMLRGRFGFEKVRPFGMMEACYGENLLTDKYGKLINACYGDYSTREKQKVNLYDEAYVDRAWATATVIDRWSSNYCANMLFVKLRSLGFDTSAPISEEELNIALSSENNRKWIQRTEHNRWVTERLLLGFRPLYKEELECWKGLDKSSRKKDKKEQKKEMKHVDICSNEQLLKVDREVAEFDNAVNSKLWTIYNLIMEAKKINT